MLNKQNKVETRMIHPGATSTGTETELGSAENDV